MKDYRTLIQGMEKDVLNYMLGYEEPPNEGRRARARREILVSAMFTLEDLEDIKNTLAYAFSEGWIEVK
jgi:hypothetical protein